MFSKRERIRSKLHFEGKKDAVERTSKRKKREQDGVIKKKRHASDPEFLDFDKQKLLDEVLKLKRGDRVSILNLII